ncbi:EF-hand, partial [Basidiobolus meristosporus CBS 931.73]
GITCNNCGTSPIRGLRFKCSNCVDYDLCETCEAQECHNKTHIFLKIRIPIPPLANPRSALLNVFYPGKFNIASSLPYELSRDLQKKTHFDQVELEALFDQFKSLATAEGEGIVKPVFEQCLGPLGMEKNLITERIFKFFDQNEDGLIDFTEFVSGLSILCKGNLEEKIIHAFRGYDIDGDGLIKRDELRKVISAYFHLSTELVRDVVKAMDEEMMESFEFLPGQPVSAAFTAPIPTDELPANYSKNSEMLPTLDDDDEKWPVMEAMSQDAMDEMIDKAFSFESACKEFITFEEFRKLVENDSRLIAWFEALGSVF